MQSGYSLERRMQTMERVVARLQPQPGVIAAGFGNALPLLTSGGFRGFTFRPPVNPSTEIEVSLMQRVVSPGYFSALGLRVKAGRTFTDQDTMTSPMVIVVNRSFASKYLGANPLGQVVPDLGMCRDHERWNVVGVVDDMAQGGPADEPQAEIFMPARQIACAGAISDAIVVIRTAGDPASYSQTLRGLLREEAPALAVESMMTMEERLGANLARPRLYAVALGGFSVFALVIAAAGLFGVLSYSVAQRTREIGIRTALGARPRQIVRLVLGQAAAIAVGGLAAGLWLSALAAKLVSRLLYGVTPTDFLSFGVVTILVVLVCACACVLPALRAARLDPLDALRVDSA
jgi:putative ABC transport system permease protein